jgi:hypothetical protein
MGKPDKQFTIQLRSARGLSKEQTARPGATIPRAKVSFPLRFRQLAEWGVIPFPAVPSLTNRAADMAGLRPRPTELSDDRSGGQFGARPGIDGWHREDPFFEVLVVPFV